MFKVNFLPFLWFKPFGFSPFLSFFHTEIWLKQKYKDIVRKQPFPPQWVSPHPSSLLIDHFPHHCFRSIFGPKSTNSIHPLINWSKQLRSTHDMKQWTQKLSPQLELSQLEQLLAADCISCKMRGCWISNTICQSPENAPDFSPKISQNLLTIL